MLSRMENTALSFAEVDEPMEPHATQAENQPPRGALKFSYANGARPLSGYTIKRGIGRGGFGEVYFAVSDGGKEVALKLIRHNLDIELRGVTHCLNLKHPNLIALYDVRTDEAENSWVVMEYATGESLEEVIRNSPNGMPIADTLDWLQGIAAGVGYLHDHGIVHRDLKPGNIFRDDGQVKLGDYGLSKFISCSRRSGQTESIGTVHYMAPEVANGRYGKEIDIYALGIILYEMLTGHVPFEGESVGEVLMKHLTAEPSLAEVPSEYRDVIARALAKDPLRRFESVGEMMAALPPLAATMAYRPPLKETRSASDPPPQPAAGDSQDAYSTASQGAAPQGAGAAPPPPEAAAAPQMAFGAAAAAAAAGATIVDDEPIWRAVRDGWRSARDSWDRFNTPTKVVLAAVVLIGLVTNAGYVFQYGVPLVALYVLYRIVRAVVLQHEAKQQTARAMASAHPSAPPHAAPPPPQPAARSPQVELQYTVYQPPAPSGAPVAPGDWRQASARHWKHRRSQRGRSEQALPALVIKPPRERLADLLGSMILATALSAIMSVVVVLLRGDSTIAREQYAWLAGVSVLGSWAVLIPSKLWEGSAGDQTLRRVAMLVMGLAVGAAAYLAADTLMVPFGDSPKFHFERGPGIAGKFYDDKGAPMLQAYLAYFGALFVLVRWWKQADPLRSTRLSLWSTGVCVIAAALVDAIWSFPQPWGLMVAAIISVSVQLVSPYAAPHERVPARGE